MPTKKKKTAKKKTTRKKGGTSKVAKISAMAKKIRKTGEAWTTAIKRAAKQL